MSTILSAEDLNDFISPGLACIKPIVPVRANLDENEYGEVDIQIDSNGHPLEISKIDGKQQQLSPAQISLSDCLACSGCITSAEEVLVAQHSHKEFMRQLQNGGRTFVASISHQARASLAVAYNLSIEEVDTVLINLLVGQMGFSYVVGTGVGRKLSLINETRNIVEHKSLLEASGSEPSPLLSSICPGWVLYAEKTHPHVLSRVSNVKSPQQITGCLLKTLTAHDLNIKRSDIYHLSIMPCFDKKLESARPEKTDQPDAEVEIEVDVDCVLTPKELINLLAEYPEYSLDLKINTTPEYHKYAPRGFPQNSWASDSGSASGGYGYNYLKIYQQDLLSKGYEAEKFSLKTTNGKNLDVFETRLFYDGKSVASSAIVNGFRNIQNLVRKFKEGPVKVNPLVARRRARTSKAIVVEEQADPAKCDYVEIMACPGGCINGGGQISSGEVPEKEWLGNALEKYELIEKSDVDLGLLEWVAEFCERFGVKEERLVRTYFNAVEKLEGTAALFEARW